MIQKIKANFRKNGFDYRLLQRQGMIALYEQSKNNDVYGYEVHKVRLNSSAELKFRNPDGSIRVIQMPECESLASNEAFGLSGWNYQALERAEDKFKELVQLKQSQEKEAIVQGVSRNDN